MPIPVMTGRPGLKSHGGDAADQWNFKPSDPKTVRFGTAPGAAKQVRLLRITPYQTKYTTFQEGSLLTSSQLNDGEDFSMLVDQELYDETLKIREGGGGSTNVITTAQQLAGAPRLDCRRHQGPNSRCGFISPGCHRRQRCRLSRDRQCRAERQDPR